MFSKLKNDYKILLLGNIAFISLGFGLVWYKYNHFLYNALDLAIFNNIYFNLVHFGSFFSSIQGHNYLGDHFAPLMFIYLPFYAIYNHPLTLLLLQVLTLGLTSLIVYRVSKTFFEQKIINPNNFTKKLPLIFGLAWLINPLVWNINLFEFHIIPLAIPLLLLTFNYYLKNKFGFFSLFLSLSLLVREDVALIVIMLSVLAWLDRKPLKYKLLPLIAILYFLASTSIISYFNAGSLRFFTYYAWLGDSPGLILKNIFFNPLVWLVHIFSIANIDMLVGFLFPFLFLPLKKPKYLLLALLPTGQFVLSLAGGSNVVAQTHYAALFLPALLVATWDAVVELFNNKNSRWYKLITFDIGLSKLVIPILLVLTFIAFSPWGRIIINKTPTPFVKNTLYNLENENPKNILAASFDLLPQTSSRPDIYSTYYLFGGNQQYSDKPYESRKPIQKIIFNENDLLTYWLKISTLPNATQIYHDNFTNWQNILKKYSPRYEFGKPTVWLLDDKIYNPFSQNFAGCKIRETDDYYQIECIQQEPGQEIYFIKASNNLQSKIFPFIWRQTTQNGFDAYTTFYLGKNIWIEPIKLELIKITGQIELGPWLNVENKIYKEEIISEIPTI